MKHLYLTHNDSRYRGFVTDPLLYLIAGIAILTILSGVAYRIRESGKESVRLEWAEANRIQREAEAKQIAAASKALEAANAKRKIVYRTITKEVDRVVERPVYRNVCLDDGGLRCLDAAIRGEVGAGCKPDEPLPPAGKPDGKGR